MRKAKKRTTIYLEAELHMELKIKAAQTGLTLSDLVNRMLALSLANEPGGGQTPKTTLAKPTGSWEEVQRALRATAGEQAVDR